MKNPDLYAVLGNPIQHSLSPVIHAEFAKQTKQDIDYQKIFVPLEEFVATVNEFIANKGRGFNITLPFKQQAYSLANSLSSSAKIAGAVNTIVVLPNGKLFGDNTDGIGLVNDLTQNHGISLENKNILILGAGGATRGVLFPLLARKPALITIANRTLQKAVALAEEFSAHGAITASSFTELTEGQFDLIINATSASLYNEIPNIPDKIITAQTYCYDMVYGHDLTPFLKHVKKLGAKKLMDGLGMLVEQAAEAFYLWRDIRPTTKEVISELKQKLKS